MTEEAETSPPPNIIPAISSFGPSSMAAAAQASSAAVAAHQLAEYQHRMQLYEYAAQAAVRFRLNQLGSMASGTNGMPSGLGGVHPALEASSHFGHPFDPRFRFLHEEPKPQHSYIGLIAMAILSVPDKKMVLSDIYQHILDHYPYFRNRGPGWRNSIRHNLSLNDCFVKSGRSANGKGHYWAIHPANVDDFTKGDFRRRKAQRKVRRHMGLSVPDDEDSQSPTPTPQPQVLPSNAVQQFMAANAPQLIHPSTFGHHHHHLAPIRSGHHLLPLADHSVARHPSQLFASLGNHFNHQRRRLFDVESLLAPDCDSTVGDDEKRGVESERPRTRSPSPRSSESPIGLRRAVSNCSSPSISSSGEVTTTPPPESTVPIGTFASWQLQMQQLNASLLHHHHQRSLHGASGTSGGHFPGWALSSAASAAAFPTTHSAVTFLSSSSNSSSAASNNNQK